MKKFLQGCIWLAYCVIITAFISCKREVLSTGIPSAAGCQVKKIIIHTEGQKDKSGTFLYNQYGDPVEYIPEKHTGSSLRYEFRYDERRRLTDYIGYYPATASGTRFDFWTKFFYDELNRVVRDSTYYYGNYGRTLTGHANYTGYTLYTYDRQGRISRTVYRQVQNGSNNGIISDKNYSYNDRGNLAGPGNVYDDKVSIYRTNRIWMFLNRNYSVNNPVSARGYSAKGLPTAFGNVPAQGPGLSILNFLSVANAEIIYDCK